MNRTLPITCLQIRPERRPEVIDLRPRIREVVEGGDLPASRRYFLASHHTTAGFPDRRLRRRLGPDPKRLSDFLAAIREVFPPGAGYKHDDLHLRSELTPAEREGEPLNADAHLAFIGGGFTNTVSIEGSGEEPVWFVDFDGRFEDRGGNVIQRTRSVSVLGYEGETVVDRTTFRIPVPEGVAAIPLDAPGMPVVPGVKEALARTGLRVGRVRIRLADPEPGVGITLNEAEALLMNRDLVEVLAHPLRFAMEGGALSGAVIEGLNRAMEALRISPGRRARLLGRAISSASPRILRMRHSCSLAVTPEGSVEGGEGALLLGRYQSPILFQREGTPGGVRSLSVTLHAFR